MKNRKMYLYRINGKASPVTSGAAQGNVRLQKPLKLLFYTARKHRII